MSNMLDRQKTFTRLLVRGFPALGLKGISFVGACAITGNASVENQVKAVTTGPKDNGSDGTLQWRLDRLDGPFGLKAWTRQNGLRWDTLEGQAAFTLYELENGERPGDTRYWGLLRDLRSGTKSIETLVANFCWIYERPNRQLAHLDLRIRHARSVFMLMQEEMQGAPKPAPGAQAGAGAVVASGVTIAASLGEFMQSAAVLLFSVFVAGVIWNAGMKKQEPEVEVFDSEEEEILPPLEISASPTAAFDAANAQVVELEQRLMLAKELREAERKKIEDRAEELLARIKPQQEVVETQQSLVLD